MPQGLKRYQNCGDLHFVTFSCYNRLPYLTSPTARTIFEHSLESTRVRHNFKVIGYVVMPEHVHLLLTEPEGSPLSKVLQALKLSVTLQNKQRPFWHRRYYDFNVFTTAKRVEKLKYIHRNPVTRGLVQKPENWRWSSFRHYQTGNPGIVEIDSEWTAIRQNQKSVS